MRIQHLLTALLLILCITANGQVTFELERKQAVSGTKLYVDNLENVYVVNDNEIFKYRPNGTLFNRFSNKSLGKVTLIDVYNPLKILLFYRDFSRIVFLDNTLTENGSAVMLEEMDLALATLVATSYDNAFWVYDINNFRLLRMRQDLSMIVEVKNINQFVDAGIQPNFLMEREGFVYLNDPTVGIMVFDLFGTYYKTIAIKGLADFEVVDKKIFYLNGANLHVYDQKTFEDYDIALPADSAIDFAINEKHLYLLQKDTLDVYQIK